MFSFSCALTVQSTRFSVLLCCIIAKKFVLSGVLSRVLMDSAMATNWTKRKSLKSLSLVRITYRRQLCANSKGFISSLRNSPHSFAAVVALSAIHMKVVRSSILRSPTRSPTTYRLAVLLQVWCKAGIFYTHSPHWELSPSRRPNGQRCLGRKF